MYNEIWVLAERGSVYNPHMLREQSFLSCKVGEIALSQRVIWRNKETQGHKPTWKTFYCYSHSASIMTFRGRSFLQVIGYSSYNPSVSTETFCLIRTKKRSL